MDLFNYRDEYRTGKVHSLCCSNEEEMSIDFETDLYSPFHHIHQFCRCFIEKCKKPVRWCKERNGRTMHNNVWDRWGLLEKEPRTMVEIFQNEKWAIKMLVISSGKDEHLSLPGYYASSQKGVVQIHSGWLSLIN